jgi:Uma2 family endonuclease
VDDVSVAATHPGPWTPEDLYALPDDGMRHELLDGTLLVSPPPSVPHQLAARRLVAALAQAAGPDLEVLEAVGVSVPAGLLVPDVVVARAAAVHAAGRELRAEDVLTVVEIVSPSSRTSDRRWKPEAYAEAGIATYLRVELDAAGGPTVLAFTLDAGRYRQTGTAVGESPSELMVPFSVRLVAAGLLGPRS